MHSVDPVLQGQLVFVSVAVLAVWHTNCRFGFYERAFVYSSRSSSLFYCILLLLVNGFAATVSIR